LQMRARGMKSWRCQSDRWGIYTDIMENATRGIGGYS
jgi:hypothetical protein